MGFNRMLLVIDIGNTSISIGLYEDNRLEKKSWINHGHNLNEEELANAIKPFIPQECVISSVADELTDRVRNFVINTYNVNPVLINSCVKSGITTKVKHPETIGADRLANIYAAAKLYSARPLIVVDSGSATTFDVLDKEGDFIGGVIMPGFGIQSESLHAYTSKLPLINVKDVKTTVSVIQDETGDEMISGVIRGHVCSVEGLVRECEKELAAKPYVILTGGNMHILQQYMQKDLYNEANPNLTLEGIRMLYKSSKI